MIKRVIKILVCILPLLSMGVSADILRVAAAANLRFVMPELIKAYELSSEDKINVTYGASGNLATQIIHGAPYDVFFSADPFYIQILIKQQKHRGQRIDYAHSEIMLFANQHSSLTLDIELQGLKQAIEQNRLGKFAIANPKHAPYGKLAQKLLTEANLWEVIQPELLLAESASQTLQFALASNVDGAILPYPYMTQEKIKQQGRYIKLAGELSQQLIILKDASTSVEPFINFITSESAGKILIKHGYIPVTISNP
uniref:Molybdenum ABC transporter, periplasmic molybdenum-binding protein ModA n=2 Tax=Methylophaga nitratireducenticrescens TaxID=754476 RepID=I1XIB7_METNJ